MPVVNAGFVHTHYDITAVDGHVPSTEHLGKAPIANAAKLEHIDKPNNAGYEFGDQWVLVANGSVSIDGMRMKNVILANVEVYYDGGPLVLDNVYFVNCTFHMVVHPRSQSLAIAFLGSATSVTTNLTS